ncbi:MAG: MauE/DoxX family redox-associated membrane protein [Actinomycetota bacterium]
MVETITPVVHGGRRGRWAIDVVLHVAGATAAAGLFGLALGALGAVLGAPWGAAGLVLVAGVALAYGLAEASGVRMPIPQARKQVPDWWRTFFSFPVFSFLYGAGLGVGFLTYLSRGTLLAVSAACVASGRPLVGAALMVPFGLARSAVVLLALPLRTREQATALVDRLAEASRSVWWRIANAFALLAVAATAVVAATGAGRAGLQRALPAALAVAFGWSALVKLLRPDRWRRSLAGHGLPSRVAPAAVVAVPLAEAVTALLAVLGLTLAAGMLASVLLMAFSAEIVRLRLRSDGQVPCGCFGGRRTRDWRVLLARNGALLAVSVATATVTSTPRIGWPDAPEGVDLVPLVVAVGGVLVAIWTATAAASAFRQGSRRRT